MHKDITVYFRMQNKSPQSSYDFAFTHAQKKKNITEEEEIVFQRPATLVYNIISDSSDLCVSGLNTLWSLWHMQTHQQQSGPGARRSNWRWKESTPAGRLIFF